MRKTAGVVMCLPFLLWVGVRIYTSQIAIEVGLTGHMKRAADANTVPLATQEMEEVVKYLEAHSMTSDFTSILYRTPGEDVGFFYKNMKDSLEELKKVSPDASQLETSNVLIKLRETLLDSGKEGVSVTYPPGIDIFPHNTLYCLWAWVSFLALILGVITFAIGIRED